jgi:hypothetical protein
MKKYLIKSSHQIYLDDYNKGEVELVNCYTLDSFITAPNAQNAIQKYIQNDLNYKFDRQRICEDDESINVGHYNVLVDAANEEADEQEIELWKVNQCKLYSNNIRLEIYEVKPVNINK